MATITFPLWRDTYADLGSASAIPFRVRVNSDTGDIIYSGLCSPRPDGGNCRVRINDICADYLAHALPALSDLAFSALDFPLEFFVETWDGSDWNTIADSYKALPDWSYDHDFDYMTDGLSHPVAEVLSARQYFLYSVPTSQNVTIVITYSDGMNATRTIDNDSGDFSSDFNYDFLRGLAAAGAGTAVFDMREAAVSGKTIVALSVGADEYIVRDDCYDRYVLYYVNAYGGWDSILVQGTSVRSDALTRHTAELSYDNTRMPDRGRRDYAIEIVRGYTFHTHILSDDEASRMHHLLESPQVYLHDLLTGDIRPLVLTGSECTFQTFAGNGRVMPQYEITANVAQSFERR